MIRVTRLDKSEFYLNAEFILSVESTPDTHIVLLGGAKYVVTANHRPIGAGLRPFTADPLGRARQSHLVRRAIGGTNGLRAPSGARGER